MTRLFAFLASCCFVATAHADGLDGVLEKAIGAYSNKFKPPKEPDALLTITAEIKQSGPATLPPLIKTSVVQVHSDVLSQSTLLRPGPDDKRPLLMTGEPHKRIAFATKAIPSAKAVIYHLYTGSAPNEAFELGEFIRLCRTHRVPKCQVALDATLRVSKLRKLSLVEIVDVLVALRETELSGEKWAEIAMFNLVDFIVAMAKTEIPEYQRTTFVELPKSLRDQKDTLLEERVSELMSNPSPQSRELMAKWRREKEEEIRARQPVESKWADEIVRQSNDALAKATAASSAVVRISLPGDLDLARVQERINVHASRTAIIVIDPSAELRSTTCKRTRRQNLETCCCCCDCCFCDCCKQYPFSGPPVDRGCRARTARCSAAAIYTCCWPPTATCCQGDCITGMGGRCTGLHCAAKCDRCCYSCLNCGKTDIEIRIVAIGPPPAAPSHSLLLPTLDSIPASPQGLAPPTPTLSSRPEPATAAATITLSHSAPLSQTMN